MTRYRTYGKLDDPMQEVGDTGFAALASRDEPTKLQAGVVSEAVNIRMDDGKATTRLGHTTQLNLENNYLLDEANNILVTENGEAIATPDLSLPSSLIFSATFFGGIGIEDRNQIILVLTDRLLFGMEAPILKESIQYLTFSIQYFRSI